MKEKLQDLIDWWRFHLLPNILCEIGVNRVVIDNYRVLSLVPFFTPVCRRMLSGMKASFFLLKLWKPTHLCVHYGGQGNFGLDFHFFVSELKWTKIDDKNKCLLPVNSCSHCLSVLFCVLSVLVSRASPQAQVAPLRWQRLSWPTKPYRA